MELIDTHAHLAGRHLRNDTAAILERAREAEVGRIISIGSDLEDSEFNTRIAGEFEPVYATVGVHPTSIHEVHENWLDEVRERAARPKIQAIGEIGLDYYHKPMDGSEEADWRARQADFFTKQWNR